jgi:membrane-associated phospholipid phosphatase
MDIINEIGIDITLFVQGLGEWPLPAMRFFTFIGVEQFYLFIAPVLYWCVNAGLGLRVGLLLMFSSGINEAFKILFHSPRPFWIDDRVKAYGYEWSFGAPSGHAQNSILFWGTIALWVKRTWFWVFAVAVIFLIGLSRIYLGVHFFYDVILGWIIGIAILIIYVLLEKQFIGWLNRITPGQQMLVAFLGSLLLILFTVLAGTALGGWEIPVEWHNTAVTATPDAQPIASLSLEGVTTSAAAFFGMAAGAILIKPRGGFDAGGALWRRALRFIIGVVGVGILYFGLKAIFPEGESLIDLIFRYLRYASIGLWITGIAPTLFILIGLADPERTM